MGDANVTLLLRDWRQGKREALDLLTPVVYDELRRLAGYYLQRERAGHTLQSTALVHEAYIRLIDQHSVEWKSRAHFFGVAAQMIRRILVDHARGHKAAKRGAGAEKLALDDALQVGEERDLDLVALDDALKALAELDQNQAKIIELRFFAGLSLEETAEVMGTTVAIVRRDWATAKAWLFRELVRGKA